MNDFTREVILKYRELFYNEYKKISILDEFHKHGFTDYNSNEELFNDVFRHLSINHPNFEKIFDQGIDFGIYDFVLIALMNGINPDGEAKFFQELNYPLDELPLR